MFHTIIGYGSLVDIAWARSSMASLRNFRYGRIHGWMRVFDLVSIVNIKKYGHSATNEIASCTARPRIGGTLLVCIFEIPEDDYECFLRRETRLCQKTVEFEDNSGTVGEGVLCIGWSDEEYRERRKISDFEYYNQVGMFYDGLLYRTDILPSALYLQRCLEAYDGVGSDFRDNFLDCSFLGSGVSVRSYLKL